MTDDTRSEPGDATWDPEICLCGHPAATCLHAPFRGQPYRREAVRRDADIGELLTRLALLIARACHNAELAKKHGAEMSEAA